MTDLMPKFSIITITLNNAAGLEQTLHSVAGQTCNDYELIVVDGQSTDHTSQILEQHTETIDVLLSRAPAGVYDAMNQGIAQAKGHWTLFLNAGDCFFSARVLENFQADDSTDLAYGRAWEENSDAPIHYRGMSRLWNGMPFCHQALFARTSLLKQHPFDTGLKVVSEYEFLVACHLEGRRFEDLQQDICRIEPPGQSAQQVSLRMREKYRVARSAFPDKPVLIWTLAQYAREKMRAFMR